MSSRVTPIGARHLAVVARSGSTSADPRRFIARIWRYMERKTEPSRREFGIQTVPGAASFGGFILAVFIAGAAVTIVITETTKSVMQRLRGLSQRG